MDTCHKQRRWGPVLSMRGRLEEEAEDLGYRNFSLLDHGRLLFANGILRRLKRSTAVISANPGKSPGVFPVSAYILFYVRFMIIMNCQWLLNRAMKL